MFDFLKKKISAFLKPKENQEKKEKKVKKTVKTNKKAEKGKKKTKEKIVVEETIIEEIKTTDNEEIKKAESGFFSKLLNKITSSKLTEQDFEESFEDLEITLLENNVALEAVDSIKAELKSQLIDKQYKSGEAEKAIISALKSSILSLLQEPPNLIQNIKDSKEPYVILFFGINGTGKTTSVAKLAYQLKKAGISSVLAAADTFRAASIEQLKIHAEKVGVPIISSNYGSDPASVAFEAIKYAKTHSIKAVLIDTAGRMYTKANLMKEMEKIMRISNPNLKLFVGESITGNDAIDQAKTFAETVGIDGIILTKADIDEKAGTILSVSHITHKPIYFLGMGQELEDLQAFKKSTVLKHLGLE